MRAMTIAGVVLLAFTSCVTPTELSIELRSDVGYREDMSVAIAVDSPDGIAAAAPRVVVRRSWTAGGLLGNVVAVPSTDRDDLAVRVVLATGRDPSTCSASDATGCVVVRRRLRFSRGESTRAQVVLRPVCLGVYCDESSSCGADGRCGSLFSDEAAGDSGLPVPVPVVPTDDPYAAAVLADRPRHYYRLDEPKGATVARDHMGRADGMIDPTHVQLEATGAIAASTNAGAFFDGSGGIVVEGAESSNGAATVEAWMRSDAAEVEQTRTIVERIDMVASSSYGFRLAKPPRDGPAFAIFRGDDAFEVSTPGTRFAGYTHVVAVTRGTSIELYVDGRRSGVTKIAAPATALLGPLVIGGSRIGNPGFYGAIDEVAIYDYPLDADRIAEHYRAGSK